MARTVVPITEWKQVKAALTTALTGSNNDLVFTAVNSGPEGNAISVEYVDTGALSVEVSGQKITVNIDDGVTLAQAVSAAVAAHATASQMVSVDNAASNDGSGAVIVLAETNLAGGSFGPDQPTQTAGDVANGNYVVNSNGNVVLEVENTDASSHTVTFKAPAPLVSSGKAADRSETLAAGDVKLFGPFSPSMNQNSSDNELWFVTDDATVKFRAYKFQAVS